MFYRIIIILIIYQISACKRSTEPMEIFKNPRNYTWTIDTLSYQNAYQTYMFYLWGSSSKDVYATGWNSRVEGNLWHFDGESWSDVKILDYQGGVIQGALEFSCIHGFSKSDIFVGGENARSGDRKTFLMHFDGNEWREVGQSYPGIIKSMWGSSPDDIWCGSTNYIYHFNGDSLKIMPIEFPTKREVQLTDMCGISSDNIYMVGYRMDSQMPIDTTAYDLYHYNGIKWSVIDSVILTVNSNKKHFGSNISVIDGELYSAGGGVYKYVGNQWQKIFENETVYKINGTHDSNLFSSNNVGQLFHFNGEDWQEIGPANYTNRISDIWTNGKEIFCSGYVGRNTYILHGQ